AGHRECRLRRDGRAPAPDSDDAGTGNRCTGAIVMRREDYPLQEPLSEIGERYSVECWKRSSGIAGEEHGYGPDPYQRLLVFPADRPDGRVLVFWHGGGWTSGYKEWLGFMAPAFTSQGVTFVSPGY